MYRQWIVVALLGGAVTVEAQQGTGARRPRTDTTRITVSPRGGGIGYGKGVGIADLAGAASIASVAANAASIASLVDGAVSIASVVPDAQSIAAIAAEAASIATLAPSAVSIAETAISSTKSVLASDIVSTAIETALAFQGPQGTPPQRPPRIQTPRPPREPRESREWYFPLEPPMPPMPVEPPMPPMPVMPPMPPMPPMTAEPPLPPAPMVPPTPPAPLQGSAWRMPEMDIRWHADDVRWHVDDLHFDFDFKGHEFPRTMPGPAVQGDVADSLWRRGRELVNRGEYRQAANTLRTISQRYPNSALVGDALYWQAHSLYRIGSTTDLREALTALETLTSKYPNARSQPDAQPLATRIRGALAARGDEQARQQLASTAAQGQASCDKEEQAVRAEALSALIRTNPDDMSSLMRSVLARKDECSVQLRKTAVYLVGNKRDAQASSVLISVAKTDPSVDVRVDAINWLGRLPGDDVVNALGDLTRTEEDERIQRAAIRALVNHPSDRARQQIRSLVERTDAPERLRYEALSAFSPERVTSDDVAWLRSVYLKLDNQRLKSRALSTIVRVSGSDTDQWLMSIVRNEDEPSESRAIAIRRIGQTLPIADIGKMYDGASSRGLREQLISILGQRKEPEATDKLIDIAKNGTDPNLRTRAISVLSEKNDPRTRTLLLELINK